jgi:orotate phosphoribosyltransferase
MTASYRTDFLRFALEREVLRFGDFTLKSGRQSPYFFNAGLFNDGEGLLRLGEYYACALNDWGLAVDTLFGPAYKGIPLVSTLAVALARSGRNLGWSSNRKEAKDHGEGGVLLGAPLRGRVLIVDDVISAGTSVRASVNLIRAHGAEPAGVLIALDREERGQGERSAVAEVEATLGLPVFAIARLRDLLALLGSSPELAGHRPALEAYRRRYGVDGGADVGVDDDVEIRAGGPGSRGT